MQIADGILYITSSETGDVIPIKWADILMIRKEDNSVCYYYIAEGNTVETIIENKDSFSQVKYTIHRSSVLELNVGNSIIIPKSRIRDPRLNDLNLYAALTPHSSYEIAQYGRYNLKGLPFGELLEWEQTVCIENGSLLSSDTKWLTARLLYSEKVPINYKACMLQLYIETHGFEKSSNLIKEMIQQSSHFAFDLLMSGYITKTRNSDTFDLAISAIREHPVPGFINSFRIDNSHPEICIKYNNVPELAIEFGKSFQENLEYLENQSRNCEKHEFLPEETESIARNIIDRTLEIGEPECIRQLYINSNVFSRYPWWWNENIETKLLNLIKQKGNCITLIELAERTLADDQKLELVKHIISKPECYTSRELICRMFEILRSNCRTTGYYEAGKQFVTRLLLLTDPKDRKSNMGLDTKTEILRIILSNTEFQYTRSIIKNAINNLYGLTSLDYPPSIRAVISALINLDQKKETMFVRQMFLKILRNNLSFYEVKDHPRFHAILWETDLVRSKTMFGILKQELLKAGRITEFRKLLSRRIDYMF